MNVNIILEERCSWCDGTGIDWDLEERRCHGDNRLCTHCGKRDGLAMTSDGQQVYDFVKSRLRRMMAELKEEENER